MTKDDKINNAVNDLISKALQLEEDLKVAFEIYQAEGTYADRTGVMGAVRAVMDFIESLPHFRVQGLHLPFADLVLALGDVSRGAHHPLFAPSPVRGSPPQHSRIKELQLDSAVCVGLLMHGGARKKEACQRVARELCAAGYTVPGRADRAITWSTVAKWRDRIITGSRLEDNETDRYYRRLRILGKDPSQAAKLAENLLRALPKINKR